MCLFQNVNYEFASIREIFFYFLKSPFFKQNISNQLKRRFQKYVITHCVHVFSL